MHKNAVILAVIVIFIGLNISIGYIAFAAEPDYIISMVPNVNSVYRGNSLSYDLTLTSIRDFESKIDVKVNDVPEGVDVVVESKGAMLSSEEDLIFKVNVKVDSEAPAGLYDIVIEANGNGLVRSATSQLNIIGTDQIIVVIEDFWYFPNNLTIRAGSEVIWVNKDFAAHTATANNGEFDTKLLQQNQVSLAIVFDKVGIYPWFCVPHPQMVGAVKVVE
ncbi:MAG: plastocyanin/azurin family copper-binding protein [Nitrososphaerales archaeon]|jgi:plastocyanin|nr:plastocyanin/azurin family copper-binding protein [Nitrososphaerales archaeon]|tara:strand:+ start:612 stop:1268 length:657 start_codon:yes stop_codon:yes gene_type:complete